MSKDITDIENWNDDYPFLEEVWKTYKKFDNTAEDGDHLYDTLCGNFILRRINEESIKYKGFCIRLMKNLRYFSSQDDYYKLTKERCNILFNWMYKLMNEQKITPDIINKIFERYDEDMESQGNVNKCYYFRNIKIQEPINITLLDIFNDNMTTIDSTLKDRNYSNKAHGLKYVCECLKIYKHMNDTYCLKGKANIEDNKSTCSQLDEFKTKYMLYLYNKSDLSTIIPSLNNLDKDLLAKCPEKENRLQLRSDAGETLDSYPGQDSTDYAEGHKPFSKDGETITHGNEDNPMRKTITTTIGTFAGASSLLAFLYKFTPAGRLVNPKLRTTGIINNNFYGEEANEMLFDRNENNGFNSYNIGYEAV